MTHKEQENLKLLIGRSLLGWLDPQERHRLAEWLEASEANKALYERLRDNHGIVARYEAFAEYENGKQDLVVTQVSGTSSRMKRLHLALAVSSVAVVVLALCLLLPFAKVSSERDTQTRVFEEKSTGTDNKAVLTLSDGQRIAVEGNVGQIKDVSGMISNDGVMLVYTGEEPSAVSTPVGESAAIGGMKVSYNTLSVPVGSTFSVTLVDGTQVTLNSRSQLRYPVKFPVGSREVWLEGEAYFDVAKNIDAVFVVHCSTHDVTVTGTQFNVSAYKGETSVTALVTGQITLSSGSRQLTLSPGMVAVSDGHRISVIRSDIDMHTSWLENCFAFDREPLSDLLLKFERWYDIHFEMKAPVNGKSFSGYVPRYHNIEDLLEVLEVSSGLKFTPEGKTVTVHASPSKPEPVTSLTKKNK